MSSIFLREVRLKDFRTFGELTLPVPPGPGLTLLVGTNGLGKSTFFDAIEWCLTGTIRRFEDYIGRLKEGDYLTRREAESGTHCVSLTFSEGTPLVRTLREHPADDVLLELLKDPDWTKIEDIGTYLGFTHFLGQASQQRFTNRGHADQWEALKGPSGIERLEAIRTALRGRATTHAFSRRAEREGIAVNGAVQALQEWQGNARRLAELTMRGSAAGAQTQASLDARISVIEATLPASDRGTTDLAQRLAVARASIEAEQQQIAHSRGGLESLREIVVRFRDASALTVQNGERLNVLNAAIATATTQVSEAMIATTKAQEAAAAQAETVARAESEHGQRVRVRAMIAEFATLDAERQRALVDEAKLKAERDIYQVDVKNAQAALSRALAAQATLNHLDGEQAKLQLLSTRVSALEAQEKGARAQRDAATNARTAADHARGQLGAMQNAFNEALNAEAAANAKLAARRRDASELAELLSSLAAHIGHDDTNCPLCASSFPVGELRVRAQNALIVQDAHLAEDMRAFEVLRGRTTAAGQALDQLRKLISAEATAETAAMDAEAMAATERAAITTALGVSRETNLAPLVAGLLAEVAHKRASYIRDFGGTTIEVDSGQTRLNSLSAALTSLDERLAAAVQRLRRCEGAQLAIEERLVDHPKPWSVKSADVAIEEQRKLLDQARASLTDLSLKRAAAANSEAAARERLTATESERSRIEAVIRAAVGARIGARDAWQRAGMDGEPSSPAIEARSVALAGQASALAARLEEIDALARSYAALLAQDELRDLRAMMNKQAGEGAADNPVLREKQLQAQLDAARAALQLTTATREAVVAYGDHLKTEAERFSTQFLLPLNDLIDGFNRALLSTPGATVQFSAEHTVERSALAMQLRYADAVDHARYRTTLPPQIVLSEGQLAANGFSILCAASTAYRWSRWRALLLDDPLQHNDIIHAAAFVDVMRNLVELEGYQLVMSSHKRDEGEFIARKFDAAGLPCTVVELIGASKAGVRVAKPRHNAAARGLLAEREARSA